MGELEKFNLENKQVYADFKNFCAENPNKKMYAKDQFRIELHNKKEVGFSKDFLFFGLVRDTSFYDSYLNGLDDQSIDGYTFTNKNTGLIETIFIKKISPQEQLSIAKRYTSLLKQIMHEEKYKKY